MERGRNLIAAESAKGVRACYLLNFSTVHSLFFTASFFKDTLFKKQKQKALPVDHLISADIGSAAIWLNTSAVLVLRY